MNGRRALVAIASLGALGLAALVLRSGPLLPAAKWEPVDPAHLAELPVLAAISPYIEIQDAVVMGFQDHVYRFRFRIKDTVRYSAVIAEKFAQAKDGAKAMAPGPDTFERVPGLPSWWIVSTTTKAEYVPAFILDKTPPARSLTIFATRDGQSFGEIIEF